MAKTVILSLGGSIIAPKEGIDVAFLKRFSALILARARRGERFIVVCGGGSTARAYMNAAGAARKINSEEADWLGIAATVLNAKLVQTVFGKPAFGVVTDPRVKVPARAKIIIAAGWKPGCSTDYDAVLLAKRFGADTLINFSNITFVYDKDPRKHKDAKPLEWLSWKEFRKMFGSKWSPGLSAPFDPIAARAAQKLGLKVIVADGRDLPNLRGILNGSRFKGTVIG
jgi:uridylate kinase